MDKEILKLSFIAPTGYGKSTAVKIICDKFEGAVNIKLAAPLYRLQKYFYRFIGVVLTGEQDGELLQFLGCKIQKEAPDFLAQTFYRSFCKASQFANIITNDDCRPHNYQFLKNLGFKFVRIQGLQWNRNDHTKVDQGHLVEKGIENLQCNYFLDNFSSLEEYKSNVLLMMEGLIQWNKREIP